MKRAIELGHRARPTRHDVKAVTKAKAEVKHVEKTAKPGSGKRFKAMEKEIQKEGHSEESAKKIAASIGRKKYGVKKFATMGAKGRISKKR